MESEEELAQRLLAIERELGAFTEEFTRAFSFIPPGSSLLFDYLRRYREILDRYEYVKSLKTDAP